MVDLGWSGAEPRLGEVRAAAYALVGSIAEISTQVTQRVDERSRIVTFDIVTGFVEGESRFAPHGHTVSLRVSLSPAQNSSS